MRPAFKLAARARRLLRGELLSVWYDPAYRLPLTSLEAATGIEPRRADLALSHLMARGVVAARDVRRPRRIGYEDLSRVHDAAWLESLEAPETLAAVFAVDESEVIVDEVLGTVRLACGATLEAARASLSRRRPMLNLLGGFHHAGKARGAGFCPLNDIAVAAAALRAEGFRRRVVVLDLDAHPPDGSAECFAGDTSVWLGSLSGADWGPLPGVDETVLPPGCDDESYLAALETLLGRMPPAGMAFVIAGGDVLAGDRLGNLGLSVRGAQRRDARIAQALEGVPSVWLPGGGYSRDAWRVLAGTGLVLALGHVEPIPEQADPLDADFQAISHSLDPETLEGGLGLTEADLMESLQGSRGRRASRLLDFYSREGLEYALSRFGILDHLRRLGYGNFRVDTDRDDRGDRMRLFASAEGREHMLFEVVLEKRRVAERDVLYVHWLTLRHPRGRFSNRRPRLPGQEEPGLGLAREAGLLLARTAERLGLSGIAFRPAWLHTAYAARHAMQFVDAARQARFEALLADLKDVPLLDASRALAEGRVRMNGEPYAWEADEMVYWLDGQRHDPDSLLAERKRVHFSLPNPD